MELGPKRRSLYCELTALQEQAGRGTGLLGVETFSGQRLSDWPPPADRAHWDALPAAAQAERKAAVAAGGQRGSEAVETYLQRVREVHRRLDLDVLGPVGRSGEQPVIEVRQVFMPRPCRPYRSHVPGEVRRLLLADRIRAVTAHQDEEVRRTAQQALELLGGSA